MPHDSEGGITMYEQQQIPANYEAEQAVVGALIIGGNVDELTTEVNLTPDDFISVIANWCTNAFCT